MSLERFALPELPPVCLTCGGRGPLSPRTVTYTCMSGSAATVVALLGGGFASDTTVFRLKLPLCKGCGSSGRRKTLVMILMWPVVLGLFGLTFLYGLDYPALFALPIVFTVAAFVYAAVLQSRSRPKPVRVTEGLLVVNVPGHGRLTLVGQDPEEPKRAAPPARQRNAGPQLKRSVCGGCGFINFAGATECKKCQTPLSRTAAA